MLLGGSPLIIVFFGFIFVWLVVLSVFFYNIFGHYRKLTKGVNQKDLKSVLENLLKEFDQGSKRTDELVKELKNLKQESLYHIQKIGLVRFNPFSETGGNQSFCLAVLDNNDSGFVISSLHSRDTTRLYAKPIKKGKADGYELSAEEKEAIKNARKIK